MSDTFHHGVNVVEVSTGTRPLRSIATGVIGMVCTASDADGDVFPLNKAVLVGNIQSALGDAGVLGTLRRSLIGISDQGSPIVIVVRVEEGDDAAETNANVIGSITNGVASGMQALLYAKTHTGVQPRILGCPGLDTQAVATALAVVARKLRAMAYVYCAGADTVAEALTYRGLFSARELMPIYPDFTAYDVEEEEVMTAWAVARALGTRAYIDETQGWWKTLSNVPVQGVTGISADIYWDLQDPSTDAGLLNAGDVTTLVNTGQGFRFWGSRTCSDDPLFAFESAVRTAQVLQDTIAQGLLWAIDKPLHPSLARDILETINAKFRDLKAMGAIIDGSAWLDPEANAPDRLAAGKLTINYDYTPCPPLEHLHLIQKITDVYMADFADRVASGS